MLKLLYKFYKKLYNIGIGWKKKHNWRIDMRYLETNKLKELKEFFNKHKYIFGLQRNVRLKQTDEYSFKTEWFSIIKVFTNFTKAIEWYLVGSGVRELGNDYDKQVFEECFNWRKEK